MTNNWMISVLNFAFGFWNGKLAEIWGLVATSPQNFKNGDIWRIIVGINDGLQGIAYGLLILFFAMSVFKSASNFRDFRRPEYAFALFIRFVATKVAITYGMDLMTTIFSICGGVISKIGETRGSVTANVALPSEIENAISSMGFFASLPLWLITILGILLIVVLSLVMLLTVYSRFFRLYLYTAISPLPLSTFAGGITSPTGRQFIKSYIGVCMEGAIIVLACVIFNAYIGSGAMGLVGTSADGFTLVFGYLVEVIFSMMILVGLVKGADRIVKEMLAL
jgi:hypothetical protein